MKTLQELQLEYGNSTCGRSIEQFVYDYFAAIHDQYAFNKVLEYARWFEDQGPPEYRQDDWMVKQNVSSFYRQ